MRTLLLLQLVVIIETKNKKSVKKNRPKPPPINLDANANIYDNTLPIDFLNMGIGGVYDPSLGQKQPFDPIAIYLVHHRRTDEDLREILKQVAEAANKQDKPKPKPMMDSPKDTDTGKDGKGTTERLSFFDFETVQALNLAYPHIYKDKIIRSGLLFKNDDRPEPNATRPDRPRNLEDIVPEGGLPMMDTEVNEDILSWTSCDDFAKKARFHPRDVAGVDWVPFYLWSMQSYPMPEEFKFSYPTWKTVQEYKEKYGPKINRKIDWEAPMLLLRNWLEMLLVAGDRRGLFYGIPKSDIPDDIRNSTTWYPHATIRMKMVDQYLAMMFCEEHLAMMLAVVGEEPEPSESAAEAAKLGFRGVGAPVTRRGPVAPARHDNMDRK